MSSNFKEYYKNGIDLKANQEERRRLLLEKQKNERLSEQDQRRTLEEIFGKAKVNGENTYLSWRKKQQERTERTFQCIYGEQLSLQQSEWLREKPENMSDYFLVPCPKGQRSLVVAHKRQTAVYNRTGDRVAVTRSMLPGDGTETDAFTVLDCIYVRENNSFYVLDVLAFGNQQNLLYCEAEFRFFWLRSKWDELEHLEQRSDSNRKPFILVQQYDFENSLQIAECLQKYPLWPDNMPRLDGFLFYHRFASYTCGSTPLVGWLFPYMVSDMLGLPVNEEYCKPADYKDPFTFMEHFDQRLEARRLQRKGRRERGPKKTDDKFETPTQEIVANIKMEDESKTEESEEHDSLKKLLDAERALEMEQDEQNFDDCNVTEPDELNPQASA